MKNNNTAGHIAMFGANFLWGVMTPIAKSVLQTGLISAFALTTYRMLGAAILFWLASLFTRKEKVTPKDLFLLFLASLFGITFNQGCFIAGVSMTSPIDASVITTTVPIITMVLAALYLKEPITTKKVTGIILGAGGALILILSGQYLYPSGNGNNMTGNILCLMSEICFAVYYVVFRDLIRRYSPVTLMKWMFTFAAICCIPFAYSDMISIDFMNIPSSVYVSIAFIIIGATFLSYLLIPIGQQRLRPTVVSMYNYIQPIVASMLAIILGMDTLGVIKILAIVLVFSGVYVVNKSKSREQLEAEKKIIPEEG